MSFDVAGVDSLFWNAAADLMLALRSNSNCLRAIAFLTLSGRQSKSSDPGFDHRNGVPNRYFSHTHMGLVQSDDSIQAAIASITVSGT